jgi:phage shock protein A
VVSEPTFRNPPLQVMKDCLHQSVGDLVHELHRKVEKFLRKMEVRELQRKVEECQRKMDESFDRFESTLAKIKSEIWHE